jgi:hypothetical protein
MSTRKLDQFREAMGRMGIGKGSDGGSEDVGETVGGDEEGT